MGRGLFVLALGLVGSLATAQVIVFDVPDPLELAHLDAGSVYTDYVQAGRVDAGAVYTGHLEADTAAIDSLSVGLLDAGSLYSVFLQSAWVDAGAVRANDARTNFLAAGVFDAGATYTGYLEGDNAFLDALSVGFMDAGSVYSFAVRTPSIGNRDGGALAVTGSGVVAAKYTDNTEYGFSYPLVSVLLPCGHPDAGFGTIVSYVDAFGRQDWQCTAGSYNACPGCWTAPHNEVNPFYAGAPSDLPGIGNSSGIVFHKVDPGVQRAVLGSLGITVRAAGQNGTGAIAKWRIIQHNYADGGTRTIASGAMPCTAAPGQCVRYSNLYPGGAPASSGCTLSYTIGQSSLSFGEGGPVEIEVQPDGGQCLENPDLSVTGYVVPVFNPHDGGPP